VVWDLWDSNVMIRDGEIAGIIDYERAFYGDPLGEAGFADAQLLAFGDPAAFMRGYGRGPLTPAEQVCRRLYCLHLALIMVIETARPRTRRRSHGTCACWAAWPRNPVDCRPADAARA
jgi:aminoglycoside phosphotransferase (APT) family kinase protein